MEGIAEGGRAASRGGDGAEGLRCGAKKVMNVVEEAAENAKEKERILEGAEKSAIAGKVREMEKSLYLFSKCNNFVTSLLTVFKHSCYNGTQQGYKGGKILLQNIREKIQYRQYFLELKGR